MRTLILILTLTSLVACATTPTDVQSLRAQGYTRSHVTQVTATGERRENPNYELWWKESRDAGRRAHFCLVPKNLSAGYNWRLSVFVDDKESWSYESGPVQGQPSRRKGNDCTTSGPLPSGKLSWRVNFTYWQ